MPNSYSAPLIPSAFIWRRAHSLTGLWLVIFLIEHLLTNSQAALFIGEDGKGFVHAVNFLNNLPYLPVIEVILLGIPLLIHGAWGIRYLLTAQYNSFPGDGSSATLPQYGGNQAYTWQRITSLILLIGIVAHVVQMRFLDAPIRAQIGSQQLYLNRVEEDSGLYSLSKRLGFDLYDIIQIEELKQTLSKKLIVHLDKEGKSEEGVLGQELQQEQMFVAALDRLPLKEGQLIAVSPSFGMAELLVVRDTFKSKMMILLYTGLVLAACFHAFNGLWTCMITWGITLTARSQKMMRAIAIALMVIVTFLGLAAIWGTYWFNLMH
ncbi:MAG: succinate dehydrogenase [Parachlamydiaceae bacterium]